MPIAWSDQGTPLGVVVAGINPNRALDEGYSSFFELLAGQVSTAIRNARAFEDEHRRAQALAELDRAKTTFFSNISHELRTPLTLILGPTEDALARPGGALAGEELAGVHRNATRLLRLVGSLLDFSRIEAGRLEMVNYQGLGLGLWIVRELLDVMGGNISVESEPGAGACFTVRLPRCHAARRSAFAGRPG
jgi:signal transduction histidine kinase